LTIITKEWLQLTKRTKLKWEAIQKGKTNFLEAISEMLIRKEESKEDFLQRRSESSSRGGGQFRKEENCPTILLVWGGQRDSRKGRNLI